MITVVRLPQKVAARALEMGIHNICLAVDFEKSCEACRVIMNQALDEFYGGSDDSETALGAILSDLMEEND